jgi:hypothetical protein
VVRVREVRVDTPVRYAGREVVVTVVSPVTHQGRPVEVVDADAQPPEPKPRRKKKG